MDIAAIIVFGILNVVAAFFTPRISIFKRFKSRKRRFFFEVLRFLPAAISFLIPNTILLVYIYTTFGNHKPDFATHFLSAGFFASTGGGMLAGLFLRDFISACREAALISSLKGE